jgi:glutathione peroxidase
MSRYAAALLIALGAAAMSAAADTEPAKKAGPALAFKMKDIDGKEIDLAKFQGKVVMFVNVASKCGLTPQYKALQATYDKYKDKGLVIVGVPANEFGKQEPGTDTEIKEFCTSEYKVTFPMLSKVVVKGKGITPLYDYLTNKTDKKLQGEIKWNFTKFIVGRDGEVKARFEPRTAPTDKAVTSAIEAALKKE